MSKSIQARKLNKRSGIPVDATWTTVPYGSLIEIVGQDRDDVRFMYLNDLYSSADDVLKAALGPRALEVVEPAPGPVAVPAAASAATAAPHVMPGAGAHLHWERLSSDGPLHVSRAKVPGGWLVLAGNAALTFFPDPRHSWDGASLD